jgi:tetratricopeptide (TPR) repeat protein
VAFRQGDFHTARDYYEQGLQLARKIGRQDAIADSLNNMGNVCNDLGEIDAALEYNRQSSELMREALELAPEFDLTLLALTALTGMAELHLLTGDALRCGTLLGLVDHHPATNDELRESRLVLSL